MVKILTNGHFKPGFHYQSWRLQLMGDRFPLPINMGRDDGRVVSTSRVDGPDKRSPVNLGSGNRILVLHTPIEKLNQSRWAWAVQNPWKHHTATAVYRQCNEMTRKNLISNVYVVSIKTIYKQLLL